MTIERAMDLPLGTVLYELDSILGPHQRKVTLEPGHTWDCDDPLVSKEYLVGELRINGEKFYPCHCFFESYAECRQHEILP